MKIKKLSFELGIVSIAILVLAFLSQKHYLLFHTSAEIFTICVAVNIAIIISISRLTTENPYFKFLGISCAFAAIFDFIHTLAYEGMNVFPEYGTNLAPQMWLIARFFESTSMLMAFYFIRRPFRSIYAIGIYGAMSLLLLLSVFSWGIFPTAFVDGQGLTPFKIWSEYVICGFLLASVWLLYREREMFHPQVALLLMLFYLLTVGTELTLTFYSTMYGLTNLIGHIFKVVAFYCLYRAVVWTSIQEPFKSLFFKLHNANTTLAEQSHALNSANEALRQENAERRRVEEKLRLSERSLRRDFQLGEIIQRASLPPDCENERVVIRGLYYPQHFVSGDMYGYYYDRSADTLFGFVLDVMGHGLPTALQTFSAKGLFQEIVNLKGSISNRLVEANKRIGSFITEDTLIAAICFEFNFGTRELRYSAAGLNYVFMVSGGNSRQDKIPGLLLGVSENPEFEEHSVVFAAEDSFYFMTDGLYEPYIKRGITGEPDFDLNIGRLKLLAESGLADDAAALCILVK